MTIIKGGNLKCWRWWDRKWWKIGSIDWFSSNVWWCWIPGMFRGTRSSCKQFFGVEHGDWSSRWCQSQLLGVWKLQWGNGWWHFWCFLNQWILAFLHFLVYPSTFYDDDRPEFLIDLEKFQPLKEVFSSGSLCLCFCFKPDSSIGTMIEMPPTAQKIIVVPHKVDGIEENMVSGWIV